MGLSTKKNVMLTTPINKFVVRKLFCTYIAILRTVEIYNHLPTCLFPDRYVHKYIWSVYRVFVVTALVRLCLTDTRIFDLSMPMTERQLCMYMS